MQKSYIPYIIISLLSLIYLFIFSSSILKLTSFNPVIFNLVSTIIVFFILDNCYKLYIKKYQLNRLETIIMVSSYALIFIYFVFANQITKDPTFYLNPIPEYFTTPSYLGYLLLVGNLLVFIPLGYFYRRYNLKFSFIAIVLFAALIELLLYFLKLNNLSLANFLVHFLGFYIGYFYFLINKKKSTTWSNFSFDLRLNLSLIVILIVVFSILFNFLKN